MAVEAQIREILRQIPEADATNFIADPLEGGLTNRNFVVETRGQRWVLRLGGPNTTLLGISRTGEHDALTKAARAGLAPRVIYADLRADILVSAFVAGQVLTPALLQDPTRLWRVMDVLRRVHQGPAFHNEFNAFATVRRYHRIALSRGVPLPPDAVLAFGILTRIEAALRGRSRPAPCHNDLLSSNLIDDQAKIWVLDWEYSGMGDPFFDLGNLAVNQDFDKSACEELLRAYFGTYTPADWAHFQLMRIVSDMREAWWGFVQTALSSLKFDYLAYGVKHLERVLHNAHHEEFTGWLIRVESGTGR